MKRIMIAVTTDLNTDQRVLRIAGTLSDNGFDVMLFGRENPSSKPLNVKFQAVRCKLLASKGMMMYLLFNWRLFWYLMFHKFDLVLANDLDSLVGASLASMLKHKPLVYDSHEYFTELPELVGRRFKRRVWLAAERLFVPRASAAYTVCQSLADIYSVKYNRQFLVVRNVPYALPKPENVLVGKVIMYQGALNVGRGIEMMILAMQYLPDYELWIAGSGGVENDLRKLAAEQKSGGKIVFFGRLSPDELRSKTQLAVVGLSIEEDLGQNYHYALPNKLFDYIQARVPVIVSCLPEMQRVIEKYGVGEMLTERMPGGLAELIQKVVSQRDKYEEKLDIAASELNWENECKTLVDIYKRYE
ncbi:MAG: glycosyltransferase [Salinivirgaceae bacterium]|nr:glycosyltransferase [Salinivirgaceae bacterium]